MIITYILILALASSPSTQTGTGIISQEFNTKESCEIAGKSLTADVTKRKNYVLTWGCFKK